MLWLHPAAWLGLAALAAPFLIHLLVHRRSTLFLFPTLRFLQPTRLASLRRHHIDDLPLLLVRTAILAAVVAALAGPLLLTPMRRAAWNRRVARAIVVDSAEPGRAARLDAARKEAASAFRATTIETADPGEGMRRAAAWLAGVPPAQREIVCVSPLAIGAVTPADVSAVPPAIGLRFVRSGVLPGARTIAGAPVLTSAALTAGTAAQAGPNDRTDAPVGRPDAGPDLRVRAMVVDRTITLTGRQTSVRDVGEQDRRNQETNVTGHLGVRPATLPIDIVAAADAQPIVAAAVAAVLAERTLVPAAGRTATLLIGEPPSAAAVRSSAVAIHTPWIGDAAARIAADQDVTRAASAAHTSGIHGGPPDGRWLPIASDADGAPIVAVAQAHNQLVVASAAAPSGLLTPVLIRSILAAMSAPEAPRRAEIVPIADARLRAWTRPAGPALMPDAHSAGVVDDDRRWLWAAALCLLALETWMRTRRPASRAVEDPFEKGIDRVVA